ncbi:uncharacterized protein LOC136032729 isoform X2 [Artemia franciscana]|uniref:uncharacterized protein LOC136032729 isoform X2 n=1 Tax=Artemia franciscana TaxID=6661 RepID=UPI0032DB0B65
MFIWLWSYTDHEGYSKEVFGPNVFTENETIAKYAIMDGAPVGGESIPIRVCLSGYGLTPTMRDIAKKFLVRYFLNLVLVDGVEIFQATRPNVFTENETLAKYAIMDGAPVGGESIPIRVCLSGYGLTPTMRDIATGNRFSPNSNFSLGFLFYL